MPWVSKIEPRLSPATDDGKLRFIWVTDTHIVNLASVPTPDFLSAINDCNEWRPDGFIHTGDIGNNVPNAVYSAFYMMHNCFRPFYANIGNHDEYEAVACAPQTAAIEQVNAFDQSAPFYWATTVKNALVVLLDCNFYNDVASPCHVVGDRVGYNAGEPPGGYTRQLGATQLAWLSSILAESNADFVIVIIHYPPVAASLLDSASLGTILSGDGRSIIGLCGHAHQDAKTYSLSGLTFYKPPALQDSGAWTRLTITAAGAIESAVVYNFTNPGGWSIDPPFTLAP